MSEEKINPQTKETLERAVETIQNRQETFNQALVAFAFEKAANSVLKICYGLITFLSQDMAKPEPFHYEYDKLIIIRQLMDTENAIRLLEGMYYKNVIDIEELPSISFQGSLHSINFIDSRSRSGYTRTEWPSIHVSGSIKDTFRGTLTQDSLVSLEFPLFPNGVEALRTSLNMELNEEAYGFNSQVEIVIPDYRGKITGLVIDGRRVTLDFLLGLEQKEDMLAKFYSRGPNGSQFSENIPLKENQLSLELDEEPLVIEAHLLSSDNGSTIDMISYDYRYSRTWNGITLKDEQVLLQDLIDRGETQTVEFKRELNKKRKHKLLETVVSFSNTVGGRILIGVDDNCKITGIFEASIGEVIESWVSEFCDPPIKATYRVAQLQGMNIGIIDVPEGENKPYVLRDHGPYVRRGSTDKIAHRSELDEFYQKKKGNVYF